MRTITEIIEHGNRPSVHGNRPSVQGIRQLDRYKDAFEKEGPNKVWKTMLELY